MVSRDFVPIAQASRPRAARASRYGLWIHVECGRHPRLPKKAAENQTEGQYWNRERSLIAKENPAGWMRGFPSWRTGISGRGPPTVDR
jgi:hypothetical protein